MLELIDCASTREKLERLQGFDPSSQAWIVSDLQSKWQIQEKLLERFGVLEDTSVLRATELWKHLAFQYLPNVQLLSPELAQTVFWNWLEAMDLPWAKSPQAVPVLLSQMQMWMTIYSDPNAQDVLSQWFGENESSYVRWGHWFELGRTIWDRCLEQNLILPNWLPALLLREDLAQAQWDKELIFDLGPQISQVEGVLIKNLGESFNVQVFCPEAPWIDLMKNALKPYSDLRQKDFKGQMDWQPRVGDNLEFRRFSTQLAEVKDTVSRVRVWAEEGVPLGQIAIVAPDIEEYWPALQIYFAEEGVPVSKQKTAKLGSFLEMAQWIAALRTPLHKVSSANLEMHLFSGQESPRLAFDEFKILFSQVYDRKDLERARHLFEGTLAPSAAPQSLHEYLAWALSHWPTSQSDERLNHLLQILGREVPRRLTLKPSEWLSYLEGLLGRREISLEQKVPEGLWCGSLSSASWLSATHAIFLNLSEGALRQYEISPVSASEAQKVFQDTGYALASPDRQELEFEFLWFLQSPWTQLCLNFAGTDFEGKVLTPSRFWMWAAFLNQAFKDRPEMPGTTRLDEMQRLELNLLSQVRGWTPEQSEGLKIGFERDRTGAPSTWSEEAEVRLSASSLERFWQCPFIFAAQRKLKLADDPVLDLDMDRRTRGNLLHALAEDLLREPHDFELGDVEIAERIEALRVQQNIRMGEDRLWPAVRSQHVRLGRLFLRFEKEWRTRFPKTATVGREIPFACFWDLERGSPTKQTTSVSLAGRVDRVDRDSLGRYALIDYKASSGSLRNWASWIENHEIQMALYALLIETNLIGDLPGGTVVAANYYVIKESDRRKGFHSKHEDAELYSAADRHRNFISDQDKQKMFEELQREVQSALHKIVRGELNPAPEDPKICHDCAWRNLCRAPHLN